MMDDKKFEASMALQSVYQQRACPPDEILIDGINAEENGEKLKLHLSYCRHCQARLELTKEDQRAWQELGSRMLAELSLEKSSRKPEPAPGQIWSLDRKLGDWGPYERYYTPPLVLILELQDQGQTLRVAPICSEEVLQGGDGADVWLRNDIGFAESWNIFSVHRDHLNVCRAKVKKRLAAEVLMKSRAPREEVLLSPRVRRFRELEVQVGAFIAMQALPRVMEVVEMATVEERELIPGLTAILGEIGQFGIRIKSEALEVLRATFAQPSFNAARSEIRSLEPAKRAATLSPEDRIYLETNLPLVLSDAYLDPDGLKMKFRKNQQILEPPAIFAQYQNEPVAGHWQDWEKKTPFLHLPTITIIPAAYELTLVDGTLIITLEG